MNDTDVQFYGGQNDDGIDELLSEDYPSWKKSLSFSLAVLTLTMFCVVLCEISAVIKARTFTFNLYIAFILVPDCLLNFIEGWRCIGEGLNDGLIPLELCFVRNFMIIFYYYSNVFMNALIAHKVYNLVANAYKCRRTKPPTAGRVALEACSVYLFAALVAGWFVAPLDWGVVRTINEPYCYAPFGTPLFNQYLGIGLSVFISLPPFVYVFGVTYKIHKQKLLPLQGRTRVLALYFMRIIIVFIVFYFPMLTLALIMLSFPSDAVDSRDYFLLNTALTMINPIQNMVTLKFLLQKDDIRNIFSGYFSRISFMVGSRSSPTPNLQPIHNKEADASHTYVSHTSRTDPSRCLSSEIQMTRDDHVEPSELPAKSIREEEDHWDRN